MRSADTEMLHRSSDLLVFEEFSLVKLPVIDEKVEMLVWVGQSGLYDAIGNNS